MKYSYLDLDHQPDREKEILVTYRIRPRRGQSLERAAEKVAAESSIGTWTPTATLSDRIFQDLAAHVYKIDPSDNLVHIAYPLGLFEPGSLPQLGSGILGNVFSMKDLEALRVEDIEFPEAYINSFSGPALGIAGVRQLLNIHSRPIIGSIIKPKIGLNPQANAQLAYTVWSHGVDLVKDDENLTDLPINPFRERVTEVIKKQRLAERESGQPKIYAFNVTAPVSQMLERGRWVAAAGGRCLMVDLVTTGWSGVQELRRSFPEMIIHGHRAGHSAFTRMPDHGLSMLVVAKMVRLAGVDQLHTGTVIGKMEGSESEVVRINQFLHSDWGRQKPVLPIASGGLHPGMVPDLVKVLGLDLIINFGGGIHGHPDGSAAGAEAAQAAVTAASQGYSLAKAAKNSPALARALDYWSD